MPALPPVPGVLRYHLRWTVGGDSTVSTRVFWGYTGPPPTQAAMQAHAAAADTSAAGQFPPLLGPGNAYVGVDVADLASASGAVGTVTSSHGGTRLGASLPGGSCALINSTVARHYRGGKPRHYFPFGTSTDVQSPQTWTAAFLTAVLNAYTAWITAITAAPPSGTALTNEMNVSYYQGFASVQNPVTKRWKNLATPRAVPVVDQLTSRTVNPKIGTQRRRIAA